MPVRLPPSLHLTPRRALINSPTPCTRTLIRTRIARYSAASSPSSTSQQRNRTLRFGLLGIGTGAGLSLAALLYTAPLRRSSTEAEASAASDARPLAAQPLSSLLRSYVVWSLLSVTPLIDAAPRLIDWAQGTSLPGVWKATEWIVRMSFFGQFVGAESSDDCVPLLTSLSLSHLGAILNHSCEVTEKGSATAAASRSSKSAVDAGLLAELAHSIQVAAHVGSLPGTRPGGVSIAIKLSGLLSDPSVLERAAASIVPREHFSSPPAPTPPSHVGGAGTLSIPTAGLREGDVKAITELHEALRSLCVEAKRYGTRILIDAEYSWYQPAIDALYEALAVEFNALKDASAKPYESPLLFNTYQTYLRRTPSHLAASLERARVRGYALGVKLVRGAYVDKENAVWHKHAVAAPPPGLSASERQLSTEERASPVWGTKALTDACYDACALRLVQELGKELRDSNVDKPRLAVIFASHNTISGLKVIEAMLANGLATAPSTSAAHTFTQQAPPEGLLVPSHVRGRLAFGQLFGMADDLTRLFQKAFDPTTQGAPLCAKYVPYGKLDDVLPYLLRRAQENKSISSGAGAERKVIRSEMWARLRERLAI